MSSSETERLAGLFATLQELKRVKRTGWIDRGVPLADVESVADHSFLTILIAWIAATGDPGLNADKVLKLAVIHDIAESIVGDEPPYASDDVPAPSDTEAVRAFFSRHHVRTADNKAAKRLAEQAAFDHLATMMPSAARLELSELWEEYEAQETIEARFVKEVDTMEAYLQSRYYAAQDPALPVSGFADMAANEIVIPLLAGIRDAS